MDTTRDIVNETNSRIENGKRNASEALADQSREMLRELKKDPEKDVQGSTDNRGGRDDTIIDSSDSFDQEGSDLGSSGDILPEEELQSVTSRNQDGPEIDESIAAPETGGKETHAQAENREEKDIASQELSEKENPTGKEIRELRETSASYEQGKEMNPELTVRYEDLQNRTSEPLSESFRKMEEKYKDLLGKAKEEGIEAKDKPLSNAIDERLKDPDISQEKRSGLVQMRDEARNIEEASYGAKKAMEAPSQDERNKGGDTFFRKYDSIDRAEKEAGEREQGKTSPERTPGNKSDPVKDQLNKEHKALKSPAMEKGARQAAKAGKQVGNGIRQATQAAKVTRKTGERIKKVVRKAVKVLKAGVKNGVRYGVAGTVGALCASNPYTAVVYAAVMVAALAYKHMRSAKELKVQTAQGAIARGNTEVKNLTRADQNRLQHIKSVGGAR